MKKRAKKRSNMKLVSACIVAGLILIALGLVAVRSQNGSSGKVSVSSQQSDGKDARKVADAYLESVKQCDITKANGYRLLPKTVSDADVTKCKQDCPGGIDYQFIRQVGPVKNSEDHGDITKLVQLAYTFGCNGQKNNTVLSMSHSSIDNQWMVINSF